METPPPPPPPPPPPSLFDLKTIAAESRRIISAHPRHFLTLSILFVPISFSPYLFPTLHKLLTSPNHSSSEILIISFAMIIYSLFAFTSYLLAIGSITHSVHRAFHGTPLKLASSMESSIASFLPLLTIALLPQFLAFATLLFGSLLFQLFGFQSELLYFILLPVSLALSALFAWLHLNWGLAYTAAAAAVVESRCEIGDLEMEEIKRKMGYRKLICNHGLLIAFLVWTWSLLMSAVDFGPGARPGTDVVSFLHFVFFTCFVTYLLYSAFLFNAVMYMHCTAAAAEEEEEQRPLLVSVVN